MLFNFQLKIKCESGSRANIFHLSRTANCCSNLNCSKRSYFDVSYFSYGCPTLLIKTTLKFAIGLDLHTGLSRLDFTVCQLQCVHLQPRSQSHLRFENGGRHFESGDGPGNEVGSPADFFLRKIAVSCP